MNTAEQIILVILAGALAIFLILAIVAAVSVIKLVKSLRKVATSAEKIAQSAESVGELIKSTTSNITTFRFLRNIADMVTQHKSKEK